MATHSSILAWRIAMDREAWRATVHGVTESDTAEQLSTARLSSSLITLHRLLILMKLFPSCCYLLSFLRL